MEQEEYQIELAYPRPKGGQHVGLPMGVITNAFRNIFDGYEE
jgi:hypothetical protein